MPIELSWLLPDRILLSLWSGHITVQDVHILVEELGIILDAAPYTVHSVIDLSDARQLDDEAAYYYFSSRIPRHPRRGRVALVRAPFHGAALADVFNRVADRELFRLFDTREEARIFLLQHDTPPPSLQGDQDVSLQSPDDTRPSTDGPESMD
ncbi:MAG: STAS/SEC14 domain-containing protein [Chloroflexi bacterium]|nr:MAG: STAS/SEC14 domain-containing protein [Chloroflexota bacterium]